ncbi:uncharacterized protein Fot_57378 [Forsythia ovata]|uniref:Uncharacterized protein n=1 Tax=Forsythia ovata TaxID=205694 RepID=A0ABD1NVJ8_9LAMI
MREKQQSDGVFKKPVMVFNNEEISEEFSEIYSTLSKSVSVSTTVTEKRENNENVNEVRQSTPARFKNWSFSGEVEKEKTVEKTPVRRSDPSPGWARSRPVTERNGPTVHGRRDSGESSCWRSMSLVTRTHGGPSKTGNALGKSISEMQIPTKRLTTPPLLTNEDEVSIILLSPPPLPWKQPMSFQLCLLGSHFFRFLRI